MCFPSRAGILFYFCQNIHRCIFMRTSLQWAIWMLSIRFNNYFMLQWFLITFHCISLFQLTLFAQFAFLLEMQFQFCMLKLFCFFVSFSFDLHPITVWVCIISIKQTALHSWELTLHYSVFTTRRQCYVAPRNQWWVSRKKKRETICMIYRLNAMQRLYACMVPTSFSLIQDFFVFYFVREYS